MKKKFIIKEYQCDWIDGSTIESTHVFSDFFPMQYYFFNEVGRMPGVHHFWETEDEFAHFVCDYPSDCEYEDCYRLKKWDGYENYFKIDYELRYGDIKEHFNNYKALVDRISSLSGKKILLYQPKGFGTEVSVRECLNDSGVIIDKLYPLGECLPEYKVRYTLSVKFGDTFQVVGESDENDAPRYPKKRQAPALEEEDMVELPF